MARYLISKISDLNMQNSYGETPLHYAVKSKNADMVRLFVSLGAD